MELWWDKFRQGTSMCFAVWGVSGVSEGCKGRFCFSLWAEGRASRPMVGSMEWRSVMHIVRAVGARWLCT